MSWEERPLEKHVEWLLREKLQADGEKLWGRYQSTRDEFVSEVLPWIAKHGGGLTDHGIRHIADVIDNASLLLGFQNHFGDDYKSLPNNGFSPHEMLVLLAGLLLHDVGNIYGRDRHNQKIDEVWSKLNSWGLWPTNERRLVIDVGRAHSGKSRDGSKDTLKDLSITQRYFEKHSVRLAPIAAVIRFADELAEGQQRTSHFLKESNLIEKESRIFHHYAEVTRVAIDRARGRVALTYNIDVVHPDCPSDIVEQEKYLCELLKMVYERAAKMNHERQFARHYADVLVPFRETSISLTFLNHGQLIDLPLAPITLNDINISNEAVGIIEQVDPNYSISPLIKKVIGGMSDKTV
jgi:hypothetical protein